MGSLGIQDREAFSPRPDDITFSATIIDQPESGGLDRNGHSGI
jgi:hypothetical protein